MAVTDLGRRVPRRQQTTAAAADRVRSVDCPEVIDLPYDERRIIVVADKVPAAAARSSEGKPDALQIFRHVAKTGLMGAGGIAAVALLDQMKRFKDDGETIYPISRESARALRFPPGHPRQKVVYIGHPVDAGCYIPAADFHRFLFEHKVAEALRLIRSLGASTIQVLHIEGWDRREAAKLGLGLPQSFAGADIQANAEASQTQAASRQVLTEMKLTPTSEPHIPTDLVWIAHEPLWAEVAAARIESGLNEFVIDVRSTDDFGVNTGLKLLIQKTGLEAGGEFVEHKNTIWRLEGTFA